MPVKIVTALPGCSFVDMHAKSIWITGLRSWTVGCDECLLAAWTHSEHHCGYGKWVSSWRFRSCVLGSLGEGSPRGRSVDSDCWSGDYSLVVGNFKLSYLPRLGCLLPFSMKTAKPWPIIRKFLNIWWRIVDIYLFPCFLIRRISRLSVYGYDSL